MEIKLCQETSLNPPLPLPGGDLSDDALRSTLTSLRSFLISLCPAYTALKTHPFPSREGNF